MDGSNGKEKKKVEVKETDILLLVWDGEDISEFRAIDF